MKELYIDTEKLSERYDAGSRMREVALADLSQVREDAYAVSQALRSEGAHEKADILDMYVRKLSETTANITDVCAFDRAALERYSASISRIGDIVDMLD